MTTIMVVAFIVALVWAVSCYRLKRLGEWHHFWIGVALLILALSFTWPWLAVVGVVVMADDALQHALQLRWPTVRSPLHLLYRHTLYAWTHKEST